MKVLFLTDGLYPFQIGGMQKHSLVLARLLAKNKVHIHVVHCGGAEYSQEAFQSLFDEDILPYVSETVVKFPKTDPFPGHYIRENKTYSKNIFLELEDQIGEFDLIYAQGFSGWRFIKEKHQKKINIPILVNFHGLEMYQTAPSLRVMAEYSLFKNAVKWNMRNADYVYSFGGKIDEIISLLGVHADHVLLQSNGVEKNWLVEEPTLNNTRRKFIFIGRDERRKGVEELNKALEIMLQGTEPFEFTFVGPIPEKRQIKDERIHYLGEIRDTEALKAILREHDCLVCPSHAEGMPTVILEAMASGLAIIATNVGAVERLVQSNGLLLDKPQVDDLVTALQNIIRMEDNNLKTCKQNALNLVRDNFIWERVVEQKLLDFNQCVTASKN